MSSSSDLLHAFILQDRVINQLDKTVHAQGQKIERLEQLVAILGDALRERMPTPALDEFEAKERKEAPREG